MLNIFANNYGTIQPYQINKMEMKMKIGRLEIFSDGIFGVAIFCLNRNKPR